jgi:hypothetical protein
MHPTAANRSDTVLACGHGRVLGRAPRPGGSAPNALTASVRQVGVFQCGHVGNYNTPFQSKVAFVRYIRSSMPLAIPWGLNKTTRMDRQRRPPQERHQALFSCLPRAGYRLRCGVDSGSMRLGPTLPLRVGPSSAPTWGVFLCSSPAPVPDPICASHRSITPGQGEPLLDQNLPEILAADIDAGEGAPVAILAMPLDL